MLIGFLVNYVCLKSKTSELDLIKKAFPIQRRAKQGINLKNGENIEIEDINLIKDHFSPKQFKNSFLTALFLLFPSYLRCKFVANHLEDEKYLERALKKLHKSQDLISLLRIRTRLKVLEKLVMTDSQSMLSKLSKFNFVNDSSSSSNEDH